MSWKLWGVVGATNVLSASHVFYAWHSAHQKNAGGVEQPSSAATPLLSSASAELGAAKALSGLMAKKRADVKPVGNCDQATSHPLDLEARGGGVIDDAIDDSQIIAVDEAAISVDQKTPSLGLQIAPGPLKSKRYEDAIDQLLITAGSGRACALADLADIYMEGVPRIEPNPAIVV